MKNCLRIWLILPLLLFTYNKSEAQTIDKFGLEGQYGIIIPHAEDLQNISTSNPYGIQLSYSRLNASKSSWEVCNCFHYLGLQLSVQDFGNPEVLGQANSLTGFFEPICFPANHGNLH